MSQIGRPIKSLEAPRPLKSISRPSHHNPIYEVQSVEELITLTENVANTLAMGQSNADTMTILLFNLRIHGPQLEVISKDTLDRAFVAFRNASQDERLSIISRMNLLELIELRAKSWQISDGLNMYYKHKATDFQPENMIDLTLLGTSPPSSMLNQSAQILSPGELIRTSGKFVKPTKIPGKNYSKDEVVIRNADSGKVMGIKGRRVHMIEELSETIISFQRVNPGAKERLVQITGAAEDKINYAKQLIEDTIRRNASPVRLEAAQGGSCSSLASSASDEATPRANRNSFIATSNIVPNNNNGFNVPNQTVFNNISSSNNNNNNCSIGGPSGSVLNLKMPRPGGQTLLHSLSTNDASLGEYKYTVGVGQRSIKITGDCFELVRIAKLVLDDYFSSNEFLASVELGAYEHANSTVTTPTTPMSMPMIPVSHQLNSSSPFADSGIGLNMMPSGGTTVRAPNNNNNSVVDLDDDVFIVENLDTSVVDLTAASSVPVNGLTRSRRSHFSRKDSTPESCVPSGGGGGGNTLVSTSNRDVLAKDQPVVRIVHEYERLMYYAKSPHSWALPSNWAHICDMFPTIVRNKDLEDERNRFDVDKHLMLVRSNTYNKHQPATEDYSESPDPE